MIPKRTMRPEQARNMARDMLSPSRFYHTQCVAQAAEHLAEKYGVDVDKAKTAAYLHDILKEHDPADLLQRIQGSDIMNVTQIEHSPAVWHAYAGGLYVRDDLGLDDDIADAVMYHTAGSAYMSDLQKVIFIADYISEDRQFQGVPEVRELAERSLDDACVVALRNSIIHVCKKRQHIDVNSVLAFNALVDKQE